MISVALFAQVFDRELITSSNAFSYKIAVRTKDARGRSPTLPSPTLFPGRAVTQGDALDQSRESLLWSRLRSRKYGTRVVRFHPGPEHKKDIRTSGTRRLEGLIFYGSSLSSVSERLARYGSSSLSGVEHLRLLVGKDSILCSAVWLVLT